MNSVFKDKLPTFIMLLIAMTANSFGDVLLSRTMSTMGAIDIHSLSEVLPLAKSVLSQGTFWLSILCFTVFFGLWSWLLAREDVSYIMPLTAITYVISALLAGPMLGETVSPLRWAGTLLIVIGVGIVASTGKDNQETQPEEG
ncbi:DMT family transporter [bacterium]|nr:DMT family transporter [bacterium]